jgi:hypothetical protein
MNDETLVIAKFGQHFLIPKRIARPEIQEKFKMPILPKWNNGNSR